MAGACEHVITSKVWPSRLLAECDKCGDQFELRRRKPRLTFVDPKPPTRKAKS